MITGVEKLSLGDMLYLPMKNGATSSVRMIYEGDGMARSERQMSDDTWEIMKPAQLLTQPQVTYWLANLEETK